MIYWNKGEFYPVVTKQRGNIWPVLITSIILILLVLTAAYSGEDRAQRKSIAILDSGGYLTIPYPGECNAVGCVLSETYTEQWDNTKQIHQNIDMDKDGTCDINITWKPIDDPTYGIFYTILKMGECRE